MPTHFRITAQGVHHRRPRDERITHAMNKYYRNTMGIVRLQTYESAGVLGFFGISQSRKPKFLRMLPRHRDSCRGSEISRNGNLVTADRNALDLERIDEFKFDPTSVKFEQCG